LSSAKAACDFLLPKAEREILNTALEQYQPGQPDPIRVGGRGLLKTALRLMSAYRLKIEGIGNAEVVYTRAPKDHFRHLLICFAPGLAS
jgi:hypothetical protein